MVKRSAERDIAPHDDRGGAGIRASVNLLVLGASGGCGRHVVRHAIARGHAVTAIVRPETACELPGARVIRGDVLADGVIAAAARGHDAVISCLGIRRRWPRNPWSRLVSPPDLTARAAAAIIAAMRAARLERVLAISAAGVGDSAPRMNWVMRFLVARSRIGAAYRDLAAMEDVYAASGLAWTCVRPVTLTPGRPRRVKEVDRFGLTATIAREAVALWLLDHLTAPEPRSPMIAHA
jgi:putative NADH-flavin reductase